MRRSNKQKTSEKAISGRGKYNGKLALSEILVCTLKGINSCCGSPNSRKSWVKRNKEKQYVRRCKAHYDDKTCPDSVNIDEKALHDGIVEALFPKETQNNILQFPLLRDRSSPFREKIQQALENEMNTQFDISEVPFQSINSRKIERLKQQAIQMVSECAANNSIHLNQDQIKALSDEAKTLQNKVDEVPLRGINSIKKQEPEIQKAVEEKMQMVTKHLAS